MNWKNMTRQTRITIVAATLAFLMVGSYVVRTEIQKAALKRNLQKLTSDHLQSLQDKEDKLNASVKSWTDSLEVQNDIIKRQDDINDKLESENAYLVSLIKASDNEVDNMDSTALLVELRGIFAAVGLDQ